MAMTRRLIVTRTRCAIVTAIVSAVFIVVCGESGEPPKVDTTAKPPPAEFKGMLNEQMKNTKIKTTR